MMAADRTPGRTPGLAPMAVLALAAFALLIAMRPAAADEWRGNNAARVDATIRPCFGMLLDAQLRACGPQRHYREDGYRYGYYGSRADATVDCDRAPPGYVEATARRIRPYGVLYLKARNRSCRASLDIDRSITIVGQGYGPNTIPVLVAPDGENCIRISPNADKVILKNVYFSSPRGANTPCVEAAGKELTLQNSLIRYQGDNAAVHVANGRFNMTESSHIIARTRGVALAVQQGEIYAENSEIASTAGGVYATLSGDSQLLGLSVQQLADWHGFARGEDAVGLDIKLDSADSILTMNDLKVAYFARGIDLDGAGEALISHSLISHSDHAVTVSVARARIIENTLIANEIGVDVESGAAYVGRNQIANVRTAGILAQSDGEIRAVDNAIDPNGEGCPTLRWGNIDPSQRVCRPWFKGSAFDVPGDAADQYMFDQFWPRMNAAGYSASPDALAKPDGNRP